VVGRRGLLLRDGCVRSVGKVLDLRMETGRAERRVVGPVLAVVVRDAVEGESAGRIAS